MRCNLRIGLVALAAAVFVGLPACTMEWDEGAPGIPLEGDPPPLSSLQRLNLKVAGQAALMQSATGKPWTAFCEFWSSGAGGARGCKRFHLVALDRNPGDEIVAADDFQLRYRALYAIKHPGAEPCCERITHHRPGDLPSSDVTFMMPKGKALLYVNDGGWDDVFVYWVLDKSTKQFDLYRRDQKYQRHVPVPDGVDPAAPQNTKGFEFLLTSDGATLVMRTPDGALSALSTLSEQTVALGPQPADWTLDNPRHAALVFDAEGVRSLPLDGSAPRTLVTGAVDLTTLRLTSDTMYWTAGSDLLRVPLDGSRAPEVARSGAARLFALGPNGELVYSTDPADRYAGGAGDGWIGDWHFMERGRRLRWSADGTRLRFLEHSAVLGTYGELDSVVIPPSGTRGAGTPAPLALNVRTFDDLPDNRILAIENRVYAGAWNRLVVIDEIARTKRWVVPSATEFFIVPGAREIIADVVSGASGFDIYRVPAP